MKASILYAFLITLSTCSSAFRESQTCTPRSLCSSLIPRILPLIMCIAASLILPKCIPKSSANYQGPLYLLHPRCYSSGRRALTLSCESYPVDCSVNKHSYNCTCWNVTFACTSQVCYSKWCAPTPNKTCQQRLESHQRYLVCYWDLWHFKSVYLPHAPVWATTESPTLLQLDKHISCDNNNKYIQSITSYW